MKKKLCWLRRLVVPPGNETKAFVYKACRDTGLYPYLPQTAGKDDIQKKNHWPGQWLKLGRMGSLGIIPVGVYQ